MRIVQQFSFNNGKELLEEKKKEILDEVQKIITALDVSDCKDKESKEKTKPNELLYSPVKMNKKFKEMFKLNRWDTGRRIRCRYRNLGTAPDSVINLVSDLQQILASNYWSKSQMKRLAREKIQLIPVSLFKTVSADRLIETLAKDGYLVPHSRTKYILSSDLSIEELIEYVTPDFTGFREIDAVKDEVGVEVQFGKYAFMVYNVCAKMTIFKKHHIIEYGIEIVPVKSLQRDMSTGVAFYEQFVWDLEERGVSNLDIPVLIIGIDVD